MGKNINRLLADIINSNQDQLMENWYAGMLKKMVRRDKSAEADLRHQAVQLLPVLSSTLANTDVIDIETASWLELRGVLEDISTARARQGFTPIETVHFIFALKEPLFDLLRHSLETDPKLLSNAIAVTSVLFDRLGMFTLEVFHTAREEVIVRQQQELMELSTPVVQLWDNILALPLIGTLDSARAQVVMESLLQRIVETGAQVAIIDITGVPTVDTLIAQHLLKTITAARLMGADCIISGIRPQIAQTIVHLGISLEGVNTRATLADAFVLALKQIGSSVAIKHD